MNYYIQGDAARAEEIKAAFESKGFKFLMGSPSADVCNYHYTFITKKGFPNRYNDNLVYCIPRGEWEAQVILNHPDYKELELPIEPCFKVGDKIEATIYGIKRRVTIRAVDKTNRCYFGTLAECIGFSEQDQWHLAPKPHYDITNFKPFDKVLVRDDDNECWMPSLFGWVDSGLQDGKFVCGTSDWYQCIPFEGNEHLLGTTEPCDEQYINW